MKENNVIVASIMAILGASVVIVLAFFGINYLTDSISGDAGKILKLVMWLVLGGGIFMGAMTVASLIFIVVIEHFENKKHKN